ncbi:C6 transcription factor [Metarhizium album ARSEF 1941]|uniref:C6 transcription factor n=1 Tax=Metarhizium album (strain ARSEF 1941) TaxID=1081103 RepID=A0A0B2WUF6_METAS|nr:C6 transcription factor [Metarhizium album ARSEF 1941]KHN96570.1 C6 transcription factor [Metarhizium album ARSEF 1941]
MPDTHAVPVSTAEDESNSVFSHEDGGSSGDDATHQDGPASSGKKRKRERYQKTSCELCKARKVKCDRAEPACSWCARHNRTCVYLERQKPGSRVGFTLELETKVNRVDALLQTLWRRVEDHIANDHGAQSQILSPAVSNHALVQMDGFAQDAPGPRPPGTCRATSIQQPRGPAFSSPSWQGRDGSENAQPSAPSVTSAPSQSLPSAGAESLTPPSRLDSGRSGSTSLSGGTDFPPQDIVYTLVDLYFKNCNTWCPILDRKTTFGTFFGSTSLSEVDRILLHAIVATTLRFLKDARLSSAMRSHHYAVSKHKVMIYAMEHASIEAQRALVILALDELGTSNGPRGWNLLSVLVQNIKQLDLCEESSIYLSADAGDVPSTGSIRRVVVPQPDSWIEDESRRRLCWVVYLLDRYATIATTKFDFMLEEFKMKRLLPCSYDLFSRNVPVETGSLRTDADHPGSSGYTVNKPENLGSFSYHCQVLKIISKIHEFLKRPVNVTSSAEMSAWRNAYRSLDSALDNWLQSLPSEYSRISALCHSDPASRVANWFMLHSAYVTAVVRLHSSAAYPTVRSHIFVPSYYAMQRCLSAVQSLRDITQDVYEANGLDLVGPPFAFALWIAARLLIVHAATVGCPVDPKIDFFIDILGYVGQYWEVANTYARILARVVRRERQGVASFGGMRKSAHNLVNLTAATRQTGLDKTSSHPVALNELDNIDVFDFFNFPKILSLESTSQNGQTEVYHVQGLVNMGSDASRDGAAPDPESDWLGY